MKSLILILLLVGCNRSDRYRDRESRISRDNLTIRCMDGVKYYFHTSYQRSAMAPKFNKKGEIETCGVNSD